MHEMIPPSLRRLFRSRSHVLMVVSILALGIGTVTAMWTVLDQVVLRPLPVREQDRLVIAWSREQVRDVAHFPWDGAMFEAAERGGVPAFEGVAAVGSWGTADVVVEDEDGPRTERWAHTLGDFFGVLGARPEAGRMLRPSDDVPAPAERVVVVSDGLWASRWDRSPRAIGSALRTAAGTFTVVGVAPAGFDYPRGAQVWVPERPFHPTWDSEMPHLELDLVARLAPRATEEEAARQLRNLAPTPEEAHTYANATPVVRPFADVLLGDMRSVLFVLFGGAILVLLVAVLDVANLVLARALGRRPDVAVRRALGADIGQLVREAASESAWLGAGGAVVGAALAWIGVRALLPFAPAGLPRLDQVHGLDPLAYAVALFASALAVLAAVLLPLRRAERASPAEALRTRQASSAVAARTRHVLVGSQVALTVWVLVVGVLMTRTLLSLRGLDLGFRADNLYAVALDYTGKGVEGRPGWLDRLEQAMDQIRHESGVTGVTPLQMEPLPGNAAWQSIAYREGQTEEDGNARNPFMMWELVEPDVFDVLGVPIERGRAFRESDDASAPPVVVVSQSAARAYWPGRRALGRRIWVPWGGGPKRLWTVVGVAADTRYGDLTDPRPAIYYPLRQVDAFHSNDLLVRTTSAHPPVMPIVREALATRAPDFRATGAVSVRSRLDAPLVRPRFGALLLAIFAGIALLLAAAGVYGIMAFLVRSRRREIGVRLACGATPARAGVRVLRQGLTLALVGGVLGAAGAVASGAFFRALLYGVAPADPVSLGLAVGIAIAAAGLACWIPARVAAATDPAVVLRGE